MTIENPHNRQPEAEHQNKNKSKTKGRPASKV